MTVGSLFAGIGGFDLGFERAGAVPAWSVEIDKSCRRLLARHFPESERYEDVRQVGADTLGAVDLICGGFPCQDVSVAGRREGLAGQRSGLWWQFHRILGELRPRWVVIENVPGLLSIDEGRGFASILHGLGELGYRSAWRVLDAQYFGLAQRRKRLFIVGHLADGSAGEVLFERTGVPGDPATGRQTGQDVAFALTASVRRSGDGHGNAWNTTYPIAGTLGGSSQSGGFRTTDLDNNGAFVVAEPLTRSTCKTTSHGDGSPHNLIVAPTVTSKWAKGSGEPAGDEVQNLVYDGMQVTSKHNRQNPKPNAPAPTLYSGGSALLVRMREGKPGGGKGPLISHDASLTLGTANDQTLCNGTGVRRLTPLECERLQGFPDSWTEGHADTTRYKMLGNAVAVPVAEWIARRIMGAELTGGDT